MSVASVRGCAGSRVEDEVFKSTPLKGPGSIPGVATEFNWAVAKQGEIPSPVLISSETSAINKNQISK